jgi:hypothetical protein
MDFKSVGKMWNGYMAGSCEHGIEISGSKKKCLEFRERLSNVALQNNLAP